MLTITFYIIQPCITSKRLVNILQSSSAKLLPVSPAAMLHKLLVAKTAGPGVNASGPYWQPVPAKAEMRLILYANLSKLISPINHYHHYWDHNPHLYPVNGYFICNILGNYTAHYFEQMVLNCLFYLKTQAEISI